MPLNFAGSDMLGLGSYRTTCLWVDTAICRDYLR